MRIIIGIFIIAILGWFVFNYFGNQKLEKYRLDIDDFKRAVSSKNIQIIDVRTLSEYKKGHLKYAKNIDIFSRKFEEKIELLDKTKPTYLYCRSGKRSQRALKIMLDNGFNNIYDLKGGYITWESEANKNQN